MLRRLPSLSSSHGAEAAAREKMLQTTLFGTLPWLAPEVIQQQPYDLSVDVYSFGIVMSEIAVRKVPFHDFEGALRRAIVGGRRPTLLEDTPQVWVDLMSRCWHADPAQRPSFEEIEEELASMASSFEGADGDTGVSVVKETGGAEEESDAEERLLVLDDRMQESAI